MKDINNMKISNPCPGIVICRGILNDHEQETFIQIVQNKGGLKSTDEKTWNFFGIRGRHFDRLSNYPVEYIGILNEFFDRFKSVVEETDITLKFKPITHILTLWYPNGNGIGWHKDGYGGNDGDEGAPVYSLTLGNSCIFEYKPIEYKSIGSEKVELCSGDLIVFGGPQRLMRHRVKNVKVDSFKNIVNFNARINITARTCSSLSIEDDVKYQTDMYIKYIKSKQNNKK